MWPKLLLCKIHLMRFIRKLLMAAIAELWYAHWPHATRHTGTLDARNNSTKSTTRISSSAVFFSFHFLCCGNFVQQDQVYFLSFSFDQLSISSVVVQILQFSKLICFHADNKRKAGAAGLWQTLRWAVHFRSTKKILGINYHKSVTNEDLLHI